MNPKNRTGSNLKNSKVKVLIITGNGLNCERETFAAFDLCGASPETVHLNDLIADSERMDKYHILALIGGFSFGDHLGAGTVFANRLKHRLGGPLEKFVGDGKLVIGICNGFQTMTRLGIAPALSGESFKQEAALAHNDSGVFRDDWVWLKANPESPCVFTKGLDHFRLPIRHGEGKFTASKEVIKELETKNLVALRYSDANGKIASEFPDNPNGSINAIAGICDSSGRIFGLMPHPEAFLSPHNAPDWTKKAVEKALSKKGDGAAIFENAVKFAAKNL